MLFAEQWAHRILLCGGILLAIGVALYAGLQGWLWWLWPGAQARLDSIMTTLSELFPAFEKLERMVRLLGATVTAITAALGVYTGIYYAKRNMPARVREYLAEADQRLLADRTPLLAAVSGSRSGLRADESVFHVEPLNRALSNIGFSKLDAADTSLVKAIEEIKERLLTSNSEKQNLESQKVAAHILRGSIASARAERDAKLGKSPDEGRKLAEEEFTAALALRSNDLDALELRGRQRGLRRNVPDACKDFEKLAEAAKAIPSRATRAYRLQGEVLESTGTRQDLDEARRRLDAGLTWINGAGSLQQIEWFEKGLLLKALGRVQTERGRLPSARTHLNSAANCFSQVDTEDSRRQGAEVQKMLAALTPPALVTDDSPASLRQFKKWLRKLFG
jgi:hypothetical protein